MSSMTSLKSIEVLRTLFALYGIPEKVVSDNGPQLASEGFAQFLKQNVVRSSRFHRTIPHIMELLRVLYRRPRRF